MYMKVDTPQFQTSLIRKCKNLFPSCVVKIEKADRGGINFRLLDKRGNSRTNKISIVRYHDNLLETENIVSSIVRAGKPQYGYPKNFEKYERTDI